MIRDAAIRELDHDPRFRWRGGAVTRIENLSDIVFALAFGMLVSSASGPQTFNELTQHLLTIIPVAAGFILLVAIWNAHFTYFRRYGVGDSYVIFLNCVLLLLVLFVAYPLRFIFDSLFGFILSLSGDRTWLEAAGVDFPRAGIIMGYFALGYGLIYLVISLMYAHAVTKADVLELNETELAMTRQSIWRFRAHVLLAAITGVVAVFTPLGAIAGSLLSFVGVFAFVITRVIKVPPAEPAA
ncbi:TMEM175 family protein [Hyphomonas sp.]|uniref:TMEM175 family protein n=1 Tax=Hyphomonas sp. TaxID=87 RepID=UPI00391B925C